MLRGYADQRAGALDPALLADDGAGGREYREGSRVYRRERFDADLEAHAATLPRMAPARVVETVEGFTALEPVRAGQLVVVDDLHVPALPDATPKPRKRARAADADQLSLL